MSTFFEKIGHGVEVAAKDVAHVTVEVVDYLPHVIKLLDDTIAHEADDDGDLSTSATISGAETDSLSADGADTQTSTYGDLILSSWPAVSLTAAATLAIVASASSYISGNASAGYGTVTVNIGSTSTVVQRWSATTAQATYTANIPANTPLNTITVEVAAYGGTVAATSANKRASSIFAVSLTEVFIQ
ncbi:MAG: hypothetical protein PW735_11605 [Acidobacteriaceae bacterium]|nr:hypothetical protein [Acidobacteriaceae bacterium]